MSSNQTPHKVFTTTQEREKLFGGTPWQMRYDFVLFL
jgi:hypothetical protein